jgi:hypothetical protein
MAGEAAAEVGSCRQVDCGPTWHTVTAPTYPEHEIGTPYRTPATASRSNTVPTRMRTT